MSEKKPLHVFDPFDRLLAIVTDYMEAPFEEIINGSKSLEVVIPAEQENAQFFREENQIAFRDLDGRFRLFKIRELVDDDGERMERRAVCVPSMNELEDEPIEDIRPYNTSAKDALSKALANTHWQVGDVAELGTNSTIFYYESVLDAVWKIIDTWGGELVDRVEIEGNRIIGRYIDVVHRLGADTGKLFEIDKDIINIQRTVRSYPVTAMYGRGSGLESLDEDDEYAGAYTKKVTFANAIWSKAVGNPTDKPRGQEWVGDEEARQKYGIPNPVTGYRRHRFGFFEDSEEDNPTRLLQSTWDALQEANVPEVTFDMDIITFEGIAGYEHERVRLGDTGTAINRRIQPEIVTEARVVRMKYDVGDPSTGELTLGNYIDLYDSGRKLREEVDRIRDRTKIWDRVQYPIDDSRFVDKEPPVPSNVKVTGLFKTIMLSWDFDTASWIAAYEVYASQVQGFVPDPSNLIFRGSTGGYSFDAETNQKWYFRLRTVNRHGRPSAFTKEFSANTVRIQDIDIAIGAVNAEKLADLAVTAEKLANGAVEEQHIANLAVGNAAIQNAAINNAKIANAAINTAHIVDAAITGAKIGNAAIDTAHIANAAITNAKIANIDAAKINSGILNTSVATVQAQNGGNAVRIDGDGFKSIDSSGKTRILINVRSFGGTLINPAAIQLLGPSETLAGSISAFTNTQLFISANTNFRLNAGGTADFYAGDVATYQAQQHHWYPHGAETGWRMELLSLLEEARNQRHIYLRSNMDTYGYLGSASYRWWRLYCYHVHYNEMHKISTRDQKTDIQDVDIDDLQRVFDQITLKKYRYKIDGETVSPVESIGVIAEECPPDILDETGTSVNIDSYISVIAGAVKKLQTRVEQLEQGGSE